MAIAGSEMNFGEFGLKATTTGWITSRQIEAARRAMTRYARRGGKLWIRIFPDKSVTARAAETVGRDHPRRDEHPDRVLDLPVADREGPVRGVSL